MRRRVVLVVAAVIAASLSLTAPAPASGTPARLNNEGMATLTGGQFTGSCSAGTPNQVIGFSASGATGEHPYTLQGPPYPGTFTETGSATIDTSGDTQVTAVSATFSISATDGTQISGTISFESADGSLARCNEVYVYPTYTATITTPGPNSQTCTDSGHVARPAQVAGRHLPDPGRLRLVGRLLRRRQKRAGDKQLRTVTVS
jgi:hypothetical protein